MLPRKVARVHKGRKTNACVIYLTVGLISEEFWSLLFSSSCNLSYPEQRPSSLLNCLAANTVTQRNEELVLPNLLQKSHRGENCFSSPAD